MSSLAAVRFNEDALTQGIWVTLEKVGRMKLGCCLNPAYSKCLGQLIRENIDKLDAEPDLQEKLSRIAIARTLIFDWELKETDDGPDIPFSVEKAEEIMTDPSLVIVHRLVSAVVAEENNFLEKYVNKGKES